MSNTPYEGSPMPDYQRRRKILVVVLVVASILYFGRHLWPWHHHGVTIDINNDKDKVTSSNSSSSGYGDTVVTRTANGDGKTQVHVALPNGMKADVDVPSRFIEGRNMDIDGVGMFPGATVGRVAVDAKADGGKDHANVHIGFDAPATPAAVADWYQKRLTDKGREVSRTGDILTGKTEDGEPFTLTLTPSGDGAHGDLMIAGK